MCFGQVGLLIKNNEVNTLVIRQLNNLIHDDKRVDACIIPIGDGINLLRKR